MTAEAILAAPAAPDEASLLSRSEQRALGVRLTLAVIAGGALLLAGGLRLISPGQADVAALVAGISALLVAAPTLGAAWRSLRRPDLHGVADQLVALAVIAAWVEGDLMTAALLPLVMMAGHILEERSLLGSHEAIRALSRLTETTARRIDPVGAIEELPARALRSGDRVELRAGDLVPADGIVEDGASSLDTQSLTGESVPVDIGPGDAVMSGSLNLDGRLRVRVTRIGGDTTLGRVIALMREAERAKPPVTRLLERYADRYIVLALLLAAGAWFMTTSPAALLAVLVASCPCALVLAAPATAIAAIAVASRHGILVKGAAFLEELATVDAVVFDKTGTLTLGELRLVAALPEAGVDAAELVTLAAALGSASNHPVSRALAANHTREPPYAIEAVRETRGLGVVGFSGSERVALGRPALFRELGVVAPPAPAHDGPIAGVSRGTSFRGWLLLADEPRPEARAAVAELARLGLERRLLLTGDRATVARRIADALGISEVRAEALPEAKMAAVAAEIAAGYRPLVVGDGINDSLALKAGAVGIAMGAQGTAAALASADLVLMTNDLRRLATAIRLSRRCRRTIYANVAIGLGWTALLTIAAAAGVLGASGAIVAAILHNFSTLVVTANAGRLLKFQESDE